MFLAVPVVGIIFAVWRHVLAAVGEVPPPEPAGAEAAAPAVVPQAPT